MRGRARLRVPGLRRAPAAALELEARLAADGRVHRVHASAVTGNVLVLFDAGRLGLGELRRRVAREVAVYRARPTRAAPPDRAPRTPGPADGIDWHTREVADVMRSLSPDPVQGLSNGEVDRRLALSGPNRVPPPAPRSALEIIWQQVNSLPMLLLAGAAVGSLATGGVLDGAAILAVVIANAAIGYTTETRVERILAALKEAGTPMAFVRRDGRERVVPRAELVPGDLMLLRAGHDVPADGRVIHVAGLQTDESALTGEAVPVNKSPRAMTEPDVPIGDRASMVYAGTVVAEGAGEAIVTATGRQTELGRIRALVGEASAPPTPLERQLDETGGRLALVSMGVCGALFVLGVLRGLPIVGMFRTATSLAVAAVPEGLPTVATTTLALGMRRMLARRTLVRRLAAVESLGSTTVICVDKTGTVTENRMTVARWHVAGRDCAHEEIGAGPSDPELERAFEVAVLCNEATVAVDAGGSPEFRGSATESALLIAAAAGGVDIARLREKHPLLGILPRADGRNWMGSLHEADGERLVAVKGAPEEVLRNSSRWLAPEGDLALDAAVRRQILAVNDRMAGAGLRVLGLAFKAASTDGVESWADLTWVGLVALVDPIRAGVADAIAMCQAAGIRTVMITGDQSLTAVAVGRQLGLARDGQVRVLEAGALTRLDAAALRGIVREVDVFARVAPSQKYDVVRALQAGGEVVAMTGDGVNDGPALKVADIGVAMGRQGTDMARDLADVVLMDDEFRAIVAAVEQGRTLRANLQKALRFLLATNLSEILVAFGAMLAGGAQPLSAMQLLWINLATDVLPGLALGMEPAESAVMRQPPPAPGAPLLPRSAFAGMGFDAGVMAATTLGAFGAALRRGADPARASTIAFSTLSAGQLLYALACRSEERSGFEGLGDNPALVVSLGGILLLQAAAVAMPPLRALLGTTPLGLGDVAMVGTGAVTPLLVRETLKLMRPERPQSGGAHG